MFKFVFYRTLNSQSAASVTVANLCGLLRDRGFDVEMTLLDKRDNNIRETICKNAERHQILIYKVNSMDYEKTFHVLSELAKDKIFSKIILIGPFASLNAERIMEKNPWVDGVVLGTGEYTILELAKGLKKSTDYQEDIAVEGGVWRVDHGNRIIRKDIVHRMPLDKLPCPARDVEKIQEEKIANLEFSRGCQNLCKYCHLRAYYEQYGLSRECKTVEQVMEDIKNLYALGKRYFVFNDSVFWNDDADTDRIIELCDRLKESGMKIAFMVYLSLYHFPPMFLIEKLRKAGLIRIFVGVESLDCEVLQLIKKDKYPSFQFETIREELARLYISCHIGYIVFFPFSTLEQVEKSIEYLNDLGKMFRVGIILERIRLIPHTPMEQYMEKIQGDMIDGAYNYMIADSRVEELQKQWMDIFENKLKASYIKMELLCVAGELALSVFMQNCSYLPEDVNKLYELHKCNIEEYSKLIYRFVKESIERTRSGMSIEISSSFEKNYYELMKKLKDSWKMLYECMSKYTEFDLEKMIPTGDDI